MPDEVEHHRPLRGGAVRDVDLIDGLAEFAREFPAWTGADGFPLTWRHYVYGMAHLGRATAAEKLRLADSFAIAQNPKEWTRWNRDHRKAAGL